MPTPPLDARSTTPPPPPLHLIHPDSQDDFFAPYPTIRPLHPYQYASGSPSASSSTSPAFGSSIESDDMSSISDAIRFTRPAGLIAAGGRVKATPHVGDLLGAPSELARRMSDSSQGPGREELGATDVFPSFMTSDPSPHSIPARLSAPPLASPSSMGSAYYEMPNSASEDLPRGQTQSIRGASTILRRQLDTSRIERNPIPQGADAYYTQGHQRDPAVFDAAAAGWRDHRERRFNQESNPLLHVPERLSHSAVPISPAVPMPTRTTDRMTNDSLLSFGLTGHHLRDLQRDAIVPPIPTGSSMYESSRSTFSPSFLPAQSSSSARASSFTDGPIGPSVPPPRPSARSMVSRTNYDRLDFSPSRGDLFDMVDLSFRPESVYRHSSHVAPSTPDRSHLDRLQRLDALRTSGERHMLIDERWSLRPGGLDSLQQTASRATDASSRPARYHLDDQRDPRSRIRRSTYDQDEQSDLSRLHRTVQDAIGRRVSGDAPHSPTSLARRHREITAPYPRPPFNSRRAQDGRQGLFDGTDHHEQIQPYGQPTQSSRSDGHGSHDAHNEAVHGGPLLPVSFGWQDSGAFTDPMRTLSGRQRTSWSHEQWVADAGLPVGYSDTVSDGSAELRHPRSLSALSLRLLQICPSMTQDEQVKIARNIVRAATQFPESVRNQAVKSAIISIPWMSVAIPGMEKDVCCSICHDEYEDLTMIGLTPCKHMYHKDCLDIWLNNRETYSCPMCRRDLGVYTLMRQLCPALKTEDTLKVWMAI